MAFNWDDYETETPKKQTVKPLPKKEIKTQNHSPSYNVKPQETQETANTTPYVIEGGISKNVQYRNEHPIKETVRQAGRNTARALLPEKAENWLLGSKEDEAFLKEYENKDIKSYDDLRADYDAGKISKDDFLKGIDLRNKLDIAQAEDDYRQERNKNIGKGAVDIGSGFIPVGGGAKIAVKGAQLLRPLAGRKAAQAISQGIVGGALGGGAMGLGEGLIDRDINPIKQAAIDAGVGAIGGAAFGGAIGAIGNKIRLNKVAKRKAIPLYDRLSENALNEATTPISNYGVTNIDSNLNKQIAEQMQNNIAAEENLLKEYRALHSDMVKKYGNIENLKNLANQEFKRTSQTGEISDVVNDYRNLLEYEKTLGNARYVNNNYKSAVTGKVENKGLPKNDYTPQRTPAQVNDTITNNNIIIPENSQNINNNIPKQAEIPQSVYNEPIEKTMQKQSRLAATADNPDEIGAISKELKKQGRLPEYEVLHNADLQLQADEAIKNNFSNTYAGLLGKAQNKQSELSALDFETARQTISRLYQEGRTAEALELTEQISKKATQAGQAVQALSLWHKTTKEGAVQQAQKIISEYNKTHKKKIPSLTEEQIKKIDELTKNIQKTEPGTRENLVATQLLMKYQKELIPASAGSKLRTLQNINLLLNAKTFLRNITGNAIFSGMENIASKPLAAGIDKIIGLRTKQQTRVLPRLNEYLKGMGQGFKEGVEDVGMGINTRDGIGQRFNLNDRRSFTGVPVLEQAEKALNYSLQVPDRMFYQATLNESLANQMRAAGVDKPTAEMIKQATDEALESVYQNRGILGNAVLKARQAGNEFGNINGYGLGDALIPYAQTPANVVQQGINYSPLGFIKGGVNLSKGNQRQASLDFARALVGSGLMGGGYAAAKNGLINPAIDDYKALKNYEALGVRPNTINIGDSNISFNQLQPLSAPLTAGANLADFQEGNAINAIDRTLDSIADLSMLQSYNKFVKDMSEYGKGTAALNLAGSIPSRFTTPTYLKQINTYFDPYLRETYDPNPIIQAGNNIISGIPGASKKLPLKYDVTGQPIAKYGTEGNGIENAFNTFINPVFANQKKDDATMQKLIDLYEQTGDKSVLMPMAAKQISFKDLQGNKVKRKLSGKEVSQYQQQMGVVNKQLLDGILNTELYNMLDDDDKVKVINDTQRYVKNYIDEMLFDKPNAQKRNIIRKLTKSKQDEVVNKILKVYKNKVLPIKTNEIYKENFAQ